MSRAILLLLLVISGPSRATAAPMRYEKLSAQRVRLTLPAEIGTSWREVNIGRLQVRSISGQATIAEETLPASSTLDLSIETPGCSLFQADIGPRLFKSGKGAWRSVTRCSKIIACTSTSRAVRRRSSALVTGKTGSRIEIRPLLNPAVLVPESDLPVRLYWEGEALTLTSVRAVGPEGREVRATSDGVGIAFLRIPVNGYWTVSFSHRGATAELMFDVP